MPRLAIGACLAAETGRKLEVVRRKGRKNTLTDAGGKALDEARLTQLLAGVTREQFAMLYTRYRFAQARCHRRKVLEVACGGGVGLGYLGRVASQIAGGDIDRGNLDIARATYRDGSVELVELDAHELPFEQASFDVVILFDSIYFLASAAVAIQEFIRVLRPGGTLLLSTVNIHWAEFNPSPSATHYFEGKELKDLLRNGGLNVSVWGAFPAGRRDGSAGALGLLRRLAVSLHLIPTSVRAKEILKRVFYGPLVPIESEIRDGVVDAAPLSELDDAGLADGRFKILYFEAVK
jgi:SAM-dependent methyltransferase